MDNEINEKEIKHFKILNDINVNEKTEKKKTGSTELTYLSWVWAWAEVKKQYPSANYEILKFGEQKLPYVYDEKTGYMVFTIVEIEGIEHEMWLPVMDGANKAMKNEPYTYQVKEYKWNNQTRKNEATGKIIDKEVEAATMFDINKTLMRCLTKNLAMFGLGLYIYAGEDLPETDNSTEKEDKKLKEEKDKALEKAKDNTEKVLEEDKKNNSNVEKTYKQLLTELIQENNFDFPTICKEYKLNGKSVEKEFEGVYNILSEMIELGKEKEDLD